MAGLATAMILAGAAGAWAGTASDGDEREEIMARARSEHAERQRQGLIGGSENAEPAGETARRQQELDELSSRLQRAEQRRNGGTAPTTGLPSRLGRGDVVEAPADARPQALDRVAVLLVMKPGNRGIRRLIKTADPVLCVDRNCYISRGAFAPAASMSRARALGAANTLGTRAGACRDSLGCVFRDVTLEGRTAVVQPIDLRIVHHDRREARAVGADATCRVERFGLTCDGPIEAADYTMWLVPESVADRIGATALQAAVAGGLGSGRLIAKAR